VELIHRLGNALQVGHDDALEILDLPLPPALEGLRRKPPESDQHVDRAHVCLACQRGLGGGGDARGQLVADIGGHARLHHAAVGDPPSRSNHIEMGSIWGKAAVGAARARPPLAMPANPCVY
jgi:hypothetical protein